MRIIKFSDRLYRVYNNDKVKDVWIENGEIQIPDNIENTLTPTEMMQMEIELF